MFLGYEVELVMCLWLTGKLDGVLICKIQLVMCIV